MKDLRETMAKVIRESVDGKIKSEAKRKSSPVQDA